MSEKNNSDRMFYFNNYCDFLYSHILTNKKKKKELIENYYAVCP